MKSRSDFMKRGVAALVFLQTMGRIQQKKVGQVLDDRTWDEMPDRNL